MIKGLNHIGIVVKNIDDTMALFSKIFGAEETGRKTFLTSNRKILFMEMNPPRSRAAENQILER